MTFSEYALIFLSLVTGAIVVSFISGWSKVIRNWDAIKISRVHLAWSLVLFSYLIFYWIFDFKYWMGFINAFEWFPIALFRPVILFFCVEVLFPPDTVVVDYPSYFKTNARKFYFLVAVLQAYEIIIRIIKGVDLFEMPRALHLFDFALSLSLFFSKNRKYDWIGACLIILSAILHSI